MEDYKELATRIANCKASRKGLLKYMKSCTEYGMVWGMISCYEFVFDDTNGSAWLIVATIKPRKGKLNK